MTKVPTKLSIKAFCFSLLFFFSSIGASVLISPAGASPNSPAPLAATPLTQLQANWASPNGNVFNQNYNPQNLINSSNAQYLGLSWLFPLPIYPASLISVTGQGYGVDSTPLIINGTIFAVTQFGQAFALNAANGNVLWTTVLPIFPNSTAGLGIGPIKLHLHDGDVQFTTALFNHTPTFWIAAGDAKVYALSAANGKFELNFSVFGGTTTIAGNNPVALGSRTSNLLIDQNKGILISSIESGSSPASGRCFYRGWNILVTPPQLIWTSFCTPPQPGSNIPVDPNWETKQIASMKDAYIFRGYGADNPGGYGGPTGAVDLKALSPAQLNATLYNDWGYTNQSPACAAATSGGSTGATAAGWGSPWLLGTGPTAGLAFVNTNNKDPYSSACTPGPDLWAAAILAINETSGQWVWGFQAIPHDLWDYDCSWWQALGNETIGGVNTQVLWKTCKAGYLFELNAVTGALIWSWTPPTSIEGRCHFCYMLDPLNSTQMNWEFLNPSLKPTLIFPSAAGQFEDESAYSPTLNYLFLDGQNDPIIAGYIPMNHTNYLSNSGLTLTGINIGNAALNNNTVFAVNAATGQMVWSHFIPTQGFRGGLTTSGNVVYVALSSGELQMLNAQNGALIRNFYIGGPLNVLPSIGATASGQMQVIIPITAGLVTWGTSVPGDIVALNLQNAPSTNTVISTTTAVSTTTVGGTVTTTATTTATTTVSGAGSTTTIISTAAGTGVSTTTLYGVAAVAVIFIIATGYLAMTRGKKPTS